MCVTGANREDYFFDLNSPLENLIEECKGKNVQICSLALEQFGESGGIFSNASASENVGYVENFQIQDSKNPRRRRNLWSNSEIEKLLAGVKLYGPGHWATIHSALDFSHIRTYGDLKDKWRNLLSANKKAKTALTYKKIAQYLSTRAKKLHNSHKEPNQIKVSEVVLSTTFADLVRVVISGSSSTSPSFSDNYIEFEKEINEILV